MMDVCVIGTGYVGLVTGTCLAAIGHSVTCVDLDRDKVESLRSGRITIYEPGLGELVGRSLDEGRLRFSTDLAEVICRPRLILIVAVGTPTGEDGATADLRPLFSAVESAARLRRRAAVDGLLAVTIKSTVPAGTCRKVEEIVSRHLEPHAFTLVSNPEFLREGSAVGDFMKPDRIVVASRSPQGIEAMRELYAPLTRRGHTLFEARSVETSEMIKYASNVFLATKIALINEFARLCERTGADIEDLAAAVGLDRRIGPAGLRAGPGFGGSCFPKDLRAIVGQAKLAASPMPIAEAVVRSNEQQKSFAVDKIIRTLDDNVTALRIAVLGLSFKAGTDDCREGPALTIISDLIAAGALVTAFDPQGSSSAQDLLPLAEHATSIAEALEDADAAVIATEWPMFRELDWSSMRDLMNQPLVIDLRNCLDGSALLRAGFNYVGLGRAAAGRPRMLLDALDAELALGTVGEQAAADLTLAEATA